MIHYKPYPCESASGSPPENRPSAEESRRRGAHCTHMEASLSQLRRAKRAADESLRRAQEAPGPHSTDNSIFVALWEDHLRDREALFSAMRQFDEAREALRRPGHGQREGSQEAPDQR